MSAFTVTEDAAKLHIRIEEVGSRQAQLLQALQECKEGRCTCPTNQYERLDAIEITPGDTAIDITLTPKAGESIDRQVIDRCLEYTADKLSGSQQ
jgi:hypothetical protein